MPPKRKKKVEDNVAEETANCSKAVSIRIRYRHFVTNIFNLSII